MPSAPSPGHSRRLDGRCAGSIARVTDCLLIAVDGPAGSGKSSAARAVARALGLRYLDTGAMYRAVTWWLLTHQIPTRDPDVVAARVREPVLDVGTDPKIPVIRVDGEDAVGPIRARAVSNAVSAVAAVPEVRGYLIERQREIIGSVCSAGAGIVVEGRDIGTVVAPHATLKVFLTADPAVRAGRRGAEQTADRAVSVAQTERELKRRDRIDAPQSVMAADAVLIDSTQLTLDEVVASIVSLARERAGTVTGDPGAAGGGSAPAQRPEHMDAAWTN